MIGDFKYATCMPDVCTYGDTAVNNFVMYGTFNATALPMEMIYWGSEEKWMNIPVTEETKRHEMDSFAISMMYVKSSICQTFLHKDNIRYSNMHL